MTTDEIHKVLYDLLKQSNKKTDTIIEDLTALKMAFTEHRATSRTIAGIFGVVGGGIFTLVLTLLK